MDDKYNKEIKCASLIDLANILKFESNEYILVEPLTNGLELSLDLKIGFDGYEAAMVQKNEGGSYIIKYYTILPVAVETLAMMKYYPNNKLMDKLKDWEEDANRLPNIIKERNIQFKEGDVLFYSKSMKLDSIGDVQELILYFKDIFKEKQKNYLEKSSGLKCVKPS